MNRKTIFIIFFLLLLISSGAAAFFFFQNDQGGEIEQSDIISQESCPDGRWIDTHLHLESEAAFEKLEARMDENSVSCSLAFIYINPEDPADSMEILTDDYEGGLNRLLPYFFITPKQPGDASVANIEKVRAATGDFFKGHGELAFYRDPFRQSSLLDPNWDQIFAYSQENQFYIMFHLRDSAQVPQLEQTIEKYPKAKLLLHGPELWEELPNLMQKYPNLYYTLDTATLLFQHNVPMEKINLMYSPGEKSTFTQELGLNREEILRNSYDRWFPVIEAAPDRVLWGTDASSDWHFDQDTYGELVDFSNEFLNMLPEEYRDGYMYGNAKREFLNQ